MRQLIKAGNCVAWLLVLSAVVRAQDVVQYLPQLADGAGWMTTFTAVNQASSPVTVTIDLFASNGSPLPVLSTGRYTMPGAASE